MLKVGSVVCVITDKLVNDVNIENLFKKALNTIENNKIVNDQILTKKAEKLINKH